MPILRIKSECAVDLQVTFNLDTQQFLVVAMGDCEIAEAQKIAVDAWKEPISDWLALNKVIVATASEVLYGALGLDDPTEADQSRASDVFESLGYKKVAERTDGKRVWKKA